MYLCEPDEGLLVCEWLEVRWLQPCSRVYIHAWGHYGRHTPIPPQSQASRDRTINQPTTQTPQTQQGYHALSDYLRQGNVVSRTIAPSLARMLARCHAQTYHPCDESGKCCLCVCVCVCVYVWLSFPIP